MQTSRASEGELIAAGSGLALFIFLFLDWVLGASAWEAFDIVDVILAVIGLVPVVIVALRVAGQPVRVEEGRLFYMLGVVATVIVAVFVLEGEERKVGLFLALLAAMGLTYGGIRIGRSPTAPPPAVP